MLNCVIDKTHIVEAWTKKSISGANDYGMDERVAVMSPGPRPLSIVWLAVPQDSVGMHGLGHICTMRGRDRWVLF